MKHKLSTLLLLMAAAGLVQAGESDGCGSAVNASVNFMTAAYGGYPNDVLVQVVTVNKKKNDQLGADVITSAGNHKCALKLMPALPRKGTLDICQWSLQVVDCDSPEVMKRTVIDEPSWVAHKAAAKAFRDGMKRSAMETLATPAAIEAQ
ncbi:hypothetical protein [Pseudomonas aeruginosa]|uniref:hypothetical protein n=1 Tax=Pseudomonas aeruginosa TaxID=287 RepID=UPI001F2CCD24|nr:hypothetical protein [Pseudomonas aeruginosa]